MPGARTHTHGERVPRVKVSLRSAPRPVSFHRARCRMNKGIGLAAQCFVLLLRTSLQRKTAASNCRWGVWCPEYDYDWIMFGRSGCMKREESKEARRQVEILSLCLHSGWRAAQRQSGARWIATDGACGQASLCAR